MAQWMSCFLVALQMCHHMIDWSAVEINWDRISSGILSNFKERLASYCYSVVFLQSFVESVSNPL